MGVEGGSRVSQGFLNPHCLRVRAAEHAPRGRFDLLESRHGLAEISERGVVVPEERRAVCSIYRRVAASFPLIRH